ncbi:hypothetical protein PC41400_21740 [Paenibacillus chitinolyticus]|uniref:Uncharacterized protein n=1 Tax=Paenibacillus chitinolyticus TaxID=79263 RepID=A0A410X0B4_9BACL|nr:hypothetical protein [Paenibacillus chitinolyticus]MCY9593755.1 hypothetical protein [Paenibacillus chitinolyticus]MCY9599680.1 hypothetical protein [Paenibacillus chitinolyticus]QAV20145.1 hypothetical protein PC41400_21740 [Paenibacillus chitinolyticus]
MSNVNLKLARKRVGELTLLYRKILWIREPDGIWDWFLKREIEELEKDISAAKENMTARPGDHVNLKNIVVVSIPTFLTPDKGAAGYGG